MHARAGGDRPPPGGRRRRRRRRCRRCAATGCATRSRPRRCHRSRWLSAQARTRTSARPVAGDRVRRVLVAEDLRAAVLVKPDGLHAVTPAATSALRRDRASPQSGADASSRSPTMTVSRRDGSMCARRDARDVAGVERRAPSARTSLEVVVGQAVERELRARRGRSAPRSRSCAGSRASAPRGASRAPASRDRPLAADRAQLGERLADGVGRRVRLHARLQHERARRRAGSRTTVRAP